MKKKGFIGRWIREKAGKNAAAIFPDENLLFIGTEFGLYFSYNKGGIG